MKIIPIEGIIGWDVTEQFVRDELAAANGDDVEFHFSSPGGLIGAGLGIGAQIRNYKGHTTAVITGYAMSMSSYLPQCCDKRVAFDDTVFMVHNARGGAWGDHNDILKYGGYLQGLSGVIAKKLSKCSGQSLEQMVKWMDDETFFFGEDIMTAGFVDEMRKSEKEIDKETAMATARASYDQSVAKMAGDATAVREDLNRAMAMNLASIDDPTESKPPVNTVAVQTPASAGNKTEKEVQQMNLTELLAANPAAKAEYDAAIESAKASGKAEVQATIDKVAPFLANKEYPPVIGETALKVIKGETSDITLTAAVAAVDAVKQTAANAAAVAASGNQQDTNGQQQEQVDASAVITDDAGLEAALARHKGV